MNDRLVGLSILCLLIAAIIIVGVFVHDSYSRAIILQPDNTVVLGNIDSYRATGDGRMYKIKMSNGKTYLAPFTNITLINDHN